VRARDHIEGVMRSTQSRSLIGPNTVADRTPALGLLLPSWGRRDGLPVSSEKDQAVLSIWGCGGVKGSMDALYDDNSMAMSGFRVVM